MGGGAWKAGRDRGGRAAGAGRRRAWDGDTGWHGWPLSLVIAKNNISCLLLQTFEFLRGGSIGSLSRSEMEILRRS